MSASGGRSLRGGLARLALVGAAGYGLVAPLSIAGSNLMFGIGAGAIVLRAILFRDSREGFGQRVSRFPGLKLLLPFIAWNLICTIFAADVTKSFRVATGVYTWLFGVWSFLLIVEADSDGTAERWLRWFAGALACGLILNTLYTFYQQAYPHIVPTSDIELIRKSQRPMGWMTNALTWAQIAMLGSIWLWRSPSAKAAPNRLRLSGALAGGIGIATALTRSVWVSTCVIVLAIAKSARGRIIAVLALLVVAAVTWVALPLTSARVEELGKLFDADSPRRIIWEQAAEMTAQRPLMGYGPGMFAQYFEESGRAAAHPKVAKGHAHNNLLMATSETGVVGALLMLAFTLSWLRFLWQKGTHEARLVFWLLIGFHIIGLVEANFYDAEPSMLMAFLFGLAASRQSKTVSEVAHA